MDEMDVVPGGPLVAFTLVVPGAAVVTIGFKKGYVKWQTLAPVVGSIHGFGEAPLARPGAEAVVVERYVPVVVFTNNVVVVV